MQEQNSQINKICDSENMFSYIALTSLQLNLWHISGDLKID